MFVNDIEEVVTHSSIHCFADDSRLIQSINGSNDAPEL